MSPTLPVEVIIRILSFVVKDDALSSPRQYYPTLRAAALVSRIWKDPACEALWRDVEITSLGQASAFSQCASVPTYKTEKVRIDNTTDLKRVPGYFPPLRGLLSSLTGLKELEVGAYVPYKAAHAGFLYLQSLSSEPICLDSKVMLLTEKRSAELSSLTIRCALMRDILDRTLSPPLSHISNLTLSGDVEGEYALNISITSASTIDTLDLMDLQEDFDFFYVLENRNPVPLPHLSTFKFSWCSVSYARAYIPHFPNLQHLVTRLDDSIDLREIFALLRNPLKTLELSNTVVEDDDEFVFSHRVPELCRILKEEIQECLGLSKLEVLRIGWSRELLERLGIGEDLFEVMDGKDIRLEGLE
ncbi:hypothetical protein P7C70_g7467, partial [Phenoliferia sp. Uapishka_3]